MNSSAPKGVSRVTRFPSEISNNFANPVAMTSRPSARASRAVVPSGSCRACITWSGSNAVSKMSSETDPVFIVAGICRMGSAAFTPSHFRIVSRMAGGWIEAKETDTSQLSMIS